jgi:hypothetical protein
MFSLKNLTRVNVTGLVYHPSSCTTCHRNRHKITVNLEAEGCRGLVTMAMAGEVPFACVAAATVTDVPGRG